MKVFLAALILIGIGVAGMCFNIIFRNKAFPQTDVGSNDNMKKLGIRCMREEDDERFSKTEGGKKNGATCSGTYSESCIGCGLYPSEKKGLRPDYIRSPGYGKNNLLVRADIKY